MAQEFKIYSSLKQGVKLHFRSPVVPLKQVATLQYSVLGSYIQANFSFSFAHHISLNTHV